jgi:hypothetical protein
MSDENETVQLAVLTEYLSADHVSVLSDGETGPGQILQIIGGIIHQHSPGTPVVLTGDLARSVQDNFDARGIDVQYHLARGANLVSAKTMRNPEGSVTIYLPAWFAFGFEGEDDEGRRWRYQYAAFTAAHESAHALYRAREEDDEAIFNALQITTAEEQHYAQAAGLIIDEYRAQLAAESVLPSPSSFIESLESDATALTESMDEARRLVGSDVPTAARIHGDALTNFAKALALSAAEARARGDGASEPPRQHTSWTSFGASAWAGLRLVLERLPLGYAPADMAVLIEVTREVMELVRVLEAQSGIERAWNGDDAFMYWSAS